MRRLALALSNLPIIYKILLGNALVIVIGALGGTWLTKLFIQRSALHLAAFFAFCGIILSLTVNYFVLKTILRPLAALEETVEQVYGGNMEVRAPVHEISDPDLARLATALNTMLDRLKAHRAIIEEHQARLHHLSGQVIRAQEEERKRIARELHDETSQALTTLIINLEATEAKLPEDLASVRDQLAASRALASHTLRSVRELVLNLRPTLLDDLGLMPAVRWYARSHLESAGVDVTVEERVSSVRLPPEVETTLFRIAQEAINNIKRHAMADKAWIRLQVRDSYVTLSVEDNGRGFDFEAMQHSSERGRQLGLFGIQERTALIGGKVKIESQPGRGTRLEVVIALDEGRENRTLEDHDPSSVGR